MYERLFRHVFYPFYETVVCRRSTFRYYDAYSRNQWLPADQIEAIQWQALKALLEHAYENVPYYRTLWQGLDIHPDDIRSLRDFEKLPVLTKALVKENYQDLVAGNYRGKVMSKTTGGSTGEPFRFEYTRESYERRTVVAWRGYEWAGLPIGKRVVYLWGTDLGNVAAGKRLKGRLYQMVFNRKFLNSFTMTRDNMGSYVEAINSYKPHGIVSYVAPLFTLARHIQEAGLKVHSPKAIITGAEPLLEFQRELIESVFGCPVFNTYGCREFMLVAAECSEKKGLHINQDHLVVEVLDEEGASVKGVSGRVAITDLYNYGMPLIRYLNGDLATIGEEPCGCGRHLPLMRKIEGRELDSIRTKTGAVLPGEFFPHLLKDVEGILNYQVVQESLDGVSVVLVRGARFNPESLDFISGEVRKVLGEGFKVDYKFVPEIKLTPSGKRRVTVSQVN